MIHWLPGSVALAAVSVLLAADAKTPGRVAVEVQEDAGIRRFGYPLVAEVKMPAAAAPAGTMRLLHRDKVVPAQFTRTDGGKTVVIDFNADLAPMEKRTYTLEVGPGVVPPVEPKGGLVVTRADKATAIRSGNMTYTVRDDLRGLIASVKAGKGEYLAADSRGVRIDGVALKGTGKMTVTRSGPLAVALRYEESLELRGGRKVPVTVDLLFPRSKSWVQVDVTLPDDADVALGMVGLKLALTKSPALADVGAKSLVYTTLKDTEAVTLAAGPRVKEGWAVERGPADKMTPFVVPTKATAGPAEGWGHLADSSRCTAIAVGAFGVNDTDVLTLNGDGETSVMRRWEKKGPRTLRVWYHFVATPVQVGALTSPQSMMEPPAVRAVKAP